MARSAQEQSDAAYLRSAAKTALLAGEIGAGAALLGGIGQGAGGARQTSVSRAEGLRLKKS
jgi:hypothetical protein